MNPESFSDPDLRGLPGSDLVEQGLADLRAGNLTAEGLLLAAATSKLRDLGVAVPDGARQIDQPEITLYRTLCDGHSGGVEDPYFRYNSLRDQLDSFLSALQHRRRWQA